MIPPIAIIIFITTPFDPLIKLNISFAPAFLNSSAPSVFRVSMTNGSITAMATLVFASTLNKLELEVAFVIALLHHRVRLRLSTMAKSCDEESCDEELRQRAKRNSLRSLSFARSTKSHPFSNNSYSNIKPPLLHSQKHFLLELVDTFASLASIDACGGDAHDVVCNAVFQCSNRKI